MLKTMKACIFEYRIHKIKIENNLLHIFKKNELYEYTILNNMKN